MVKLHKNSGTGLKQCLSCNGYVGRQTKICECGYKFLTIPVRNYKYGSKSPIYNNDDIISRLLDVLHLENQLQLSNRFRNALRRKELDKRNEYYLALNNYNVDYAKYWKQEEELIKQKEDVGTKIKSQRQKDRKKHKVSLDDKNELQNIKKKLKNVRKKIKQCKQESSNDKGFQNILTELNQNYNNVLKKLYNEFTKLGLGWGTAGSTRTGCNSFFKGTPPKYKRYDGTGTLDIQIQGGTTWEYILDDKCTFIKFKEHRRNCQSSGKITIYGDISLRVGSNKRTPIYITLPIILHRPVVGKIKRVKLVCKKIATKIEYHIIFTVESDSFKLDNTSSKSIGLDLGFRKFDDRLRTACVSNKEHTVQIELSLPLSIIKGYEKVDDLSSIRDSNFNNIIKELKGWIKSNKILGWLKEETEHLCRWKSQQRLYDLMMLWRDKRFDGDQIYDNVEKWRKHDKHLYEWQGNLRCKLKRRIDNIFRKQIKELEGKFGIVKIEDIKWQKLLKDTDIEKDDGLTSKQKWYAKIASPYRFTKFLEQSSMIVKRVDPRNTTRECSYCSCLNDVKKDTLVIECQKCKRRLDRDYDAASVIDARPEVVKKTQQCLLSGLVTETTFLSQLL